MPSPFNFRFALLAGLTLGLGLVVGPGEGFAAGTAVNAGPFLQDMLARGIASVRGWPDNEIASPIVAVQYSSAQQCTLQIQAKNGRKFTIQMDKAATLHAMTPPKATANYVEIIGGTLPYDSVSVFVDDGDLFKRVTNAFTAMQKGCDKSSAMGF